MAVELRYKVLLVIGVFAGIAGMLAVLFDTNSGLNSNNDNVFKRRHVPYWVFPPAFELQNIAHSRMNAEYELRYSDSRTLVLTTNWNQRAVPAEKARDFPDEFYDDVVYAVTAWNQMAQSQSKEDNERQNEELLLEVRRMYPPPDRIVDYAAIDADSNFRERGYALFFRKPTRQVERAVLALGRVFGQVSVTKWWGHAWGVHRRKHVALMQGLVPVASAVRPVKTESQIKLVVPSHAAAQWFEELVEEDIGGAAADATPGDSFPTRKQHTSASTDL